MSRKEINTEAVMTSVAPRGPKKLEGIRFSQELRQIMERVILLKQFPHTTSSTTESTTSGSNWTVIEKANALMSVTAAQDILKGIATTFVGGEEEELVFPLSAVKAIQSLIEHSDESSECKESLIGQLDAALVHAPFVFTKIPVNDKNDEERKKYEKRMNLLRLKAEERNYKNLTANLDTYVPEDQTAKSMMYATSVGLNMIVAPICFGVFIYFFSGQLVTWIIGDDQNQRPNQVDIRRVIAGVISGVGMLFIEMTLFVIRSHEFDASIRKKAKKNSPNPFGYVPGSEKRIFNGS